mmetsp:Transcript_5719/g.11340  ORF Transcript_5719/g.11340 Transcript_5719/m.11340 type:complete len:193 (-) Transcript_5719:164-742(-)
MKMLQKFGYKRGEPLGVDKGRKRLVHPLVPKFVVPGRSLDFMHDHTQFHRDKYRNLAKNMTQGGKDVKTEELVDEAALTSQRVFNLINSAGKVNPSKEDLKIAEAKRITTKSSAKDTRRKLLELQDRKREWEQKLRSYAKSLVRNSGGGAVAEEFRARHTEARRELDSVIRQEKQLTENLRMKKRRKTAFKF